MKKLASTLAIFASASVANAAFVLVPNGDFSTAAGDSWNQAPSAGTVISYPAAGGNTGGFARIDNTAGAWGGVLVAEGGTGANPAGGGGIPLGDLGLVAGQTYAISLDIIDFGPGGTMAGIKLESWSNVGVINDSGDQNFATTTSWATYNYNYTIDPAATRIKFVPLSVGAGKDVGFDNVGVNNVPEPTSSVLLGLGALGLLARRRR